MGCSLLKDGFLDKEQEAVASSSARCIALSAGPGTGKRRTLLARALCLMEKGASPLSILFLSFSEETAESMRKGLETMLCPREGMPEVHTFRSFGAWLLSSSLLGKTRLRTGFRLLDASEEQDVLKKAIDSISGIQRKPSFSSVSKFVRHAKEQEKFPDGFAMEGEFGNQNEAILAAIYGQYDAILQKENLCDTRDTVLLPLSCFREDKQLLSRVSGRYRAILVDEWQEAGNLEAKLLLAIRPEGNGLLVAGDRNLSSKEGHGESENDIFGFLGDCSGCKHLELRQNHRSARGIVHAAEILSSSGHPPCKGRQEDALNEAVPTAKFLLFEDSASEARGIGEIILDLHNSKGLPYSSIHVMLRSHSYSHEIERELSHCRIPFRVHGGMRFLERKSVSAIMAVMKFASNPFGWRGFEAILGFFLPRFPPAQKKSLGDYAGFHGMSPHALMDEIRSGTGASSILGKREKKSLLVLWERILPVLHSASSGSGVAECLGRAYSNLLPMLLERMAEESAKEEASCCLALMESAKRYDNALREKGEKIHPARYVWHYETARERAAKPVIGDAVGIRAMKDAVGLEATAVIVAGVQERNIPSAGLPGEDLEAERRLLFLAMTRARERLVVTASRKSVTGESATPSKFLANFGWQEIRTGGGLHGGSGHDGVQQWDND